MPVKCPPSLAERVLLFWFPRPPGASGALREAIDFDFSRVGERPCSSSIGAVPSFLQILRLSLKVVLEGRLFFS